MTSTRSICLALAIAAASTLMTGCGLLLSRIQPSSTQTEPAQTAQSPAPTPTQTAQANSAPSPNASAANRTPYPADVAKNFMDACIQSGGNQSACSCLFGKIQDRYTIQEFVRLEEESKASGKLPQEIADFATACRS